MSLGEPCSLSTEMEEMIEMAVGVAAVTRVDRIVAVKEISRN